MKDETLKVYAARFGKEDQENLAEIRDWLNRTMKKLPADERPRPARKLKENYNYSDALRVAVYWMERDINLKHLNFGR